MLPMQVTFDHTLKSALMYVTGLDVKKALLASTIASKSILLTTIACH